MYANYHTHTARCMHATGIDEDYVKRAIAEGVSVLGFSDHAPMLFDNGYVSSYKMTPEELPTYTSSILSLREKYKDKIEIHLGLETEYYRDSFERSLELWRPYPVEYLLLGQHFVGTETDAVPRPSSAPSDDKDRLRQYVDIVLEGIGTGRITYIAHPDLINYTGADMDFYFSEMERLIKGAMSLRMPLEYNLLGQRAKRSYPRREFWRLASSLGAVAIVGCDAHEPWRVAHPEELDTAYKFLSEVGIKLVDRIELVNPFK